MKKVVLAVLSFASIGAIAQSFTVDDTLSAGDSQSYYVADSSAANLAGTIGAAVTWDYSGLLKYNIAQNLDTVINAIDSPDASSFPTAQHNDVMNGGTSLFFTNYVDSVITNGYTFIVDGNDIVIKHNIDPLKSLELPMSEGDSYQDSIYGELDSQSLGITGAPTLGQVTVTADGTGTLNLGASTFTGVIRIRLVEYIEATVNYFGTDYPGEVTRTVYSYYDLVNQNEPIFIHATINVSVPVIALNLGYSAVYSSIDLPEITTGIENEEISSLEIYPNPATDVVSITSENADQLIVMNALGQTIVNISNPQMVEKLDVTKFETGIYFIQIKKGNGTKTQKLIVK